LVSKASKTEGFHESFGGRHEVQGSSDRSFGLVFMAFFAIVGLWPLFGEARHLRPWALIASGTFGLVALLFPRILAPLNKLWMRFGLLLQKVVSPIVLGVLFFLVITPFALIIRALGKDLLRLRWEKAVQTYWIPRQPPGPPPETMRNQF
jgi:predicted membrane metal-binding protein